MRNRGRGVTEYLKPVNLDEIDRYPNLEIITNPYVKEPDGSYQYIESGKHQEFQFCNIIRRVELDILENGRFKSSPTDQESLTQFLNNLRPQR